MQVQRKLMNQICEKGKNPTFGPDFDPFRPKFSPQKLVLWVLPTLDVINCCKLSSRKTNEPNLRKWQKT